MTEQTVAMYCFIDDFPRLTRPQAPHKRHLSDAEILTTALLAAIWPPPGAICSYIGA